MADLVTTFAPKDEETRGGIVILSGHFCRISKLGFCKLWGGHCWYFAVADLWLNGEQKLFGELVIYFSHNSGYVFLLIYKKAKIAMLNIYACKFHQFFTNWKFLHKTPKYMYCLYCIITKSTIYAQTKPMDRLGLL